MAKHLEPKERRLYARRIGLAVGGAILAALVAQSGLGLGLSGLNPALAHRLDSGNAVAAGVLADRQMKSAQNDADVLAVESLSRRAVLGSPMEAGALRNLGFLVAIRDSEDKADPLLSLAGRLSKRDYFTHAWLLDRRFRQGNVVAAVAEADIVLRQRQTSWPVIIPELVKISGDTRTLVPMTRALVRRPAWRADYLQKLSEAGRDPRSIYAQLRLLRASAAPPAVDELRSYFARFAEQRPPAQIWSEWLALSPKTGQPGAALRDGGFEGLEAPPPFNWTLSPSDGVYAEITDSPDGPGKALYVSFEGNADAGFAYQMLTLAPGSWRIGGRAYADEAVKPDQLAVMIACGKSNNSQPVNRVFLRPEAGSWSRFAMEAKIPAGCGAQHLTVQGKVGDFRSRAAAWIDDLTVIRTAEGQASRTPDDAGVKRREAKRIAP